MTNPMENSGPPSGTWAWAIQREIDNLQRTIDSRYSDLSSRIDKVVSTTEYGADKRTSEQQHRVLIDRLSDVDKSVELFKKEFNDRLDSIRKDHDADIDKVGLLLATEKNTRETERKEDQQKLEDQKEKAESSRVEKKRWLIAAVLVPTLIALIPLILALKG